MSENVWPASVVHESYARFPLSDHKFKVYLFPTNHNVQHTEKKQHKYKSNKHIMSNQGIKKKGRNGYSPAHPIAHLFI